MKAWEVRSGMLALREAGSVEPSAIEGAMVVRVSHIGICGSDLPKLLHPDGFALPEPWRPGHEIVGTSQSGTAVAVDPLVPCGTCPPCSTGATHLCHDLRRLGWDLPGGLAEEVAVPAQNARSMPDGLDPFHAVLADPAAVAIHGLRCNPVGSPARLAIVGAGTIGLLTALYAHRQGWEVSVLHRPGRAPSAQVAAAVPAAFRSPATLPSGITYDVVVDAAAGASPAPLELALRLVRDEGTVIVQNAYHPDICLPTPLRDIFRRSIRLIGSFSHCRRRQPDDFALALRMLGERGDSLSHLVTRAGDLAELPAVLNRRPPHGRRQVLTIGNT